MTGNNQKVLLSRMYCHALEIVSNMVLPVLRRSRRTTAAVVVVVVAAAAAVVVVALDVMALTLLNDYKYCSCS